MTVHETLEMSIFHQIMFQEKSNVLSMKRLIEKPLVLNLRNETNSELLA